MNLTLKKIPDEDYKILKETAAARGRSVNAEVIRMIQELAEQEKRRKYIREHRDELERFVAKMPKLRRGTIARIIREDRDSH